MKLSYRWLQDYVDLPADAQPVADLITAHVAEVEHVDRQADQFAQMVVGVIKEITPHPKADKLKLCRVDVGTEEVGIVCGGSNIAVDQAVIVALPGAQVRWHGQGELITLATATIRGETSSGMICASSEIGLDQLFPQSSEREIIDLGKIAAQAGTPLAEALGLTDTIITIDNKTLTHRPDLFCHVGFARELSAILRTPLKLPALRQFEKNDQLPFAVTVQAREHCRRYIGVVVDHVTVKPSPDWLQQRLSAIGLRPINNVVDITNYVMVEYGQPLHAFDYDKLAGGKIVVRLAKAKETLTTLDGKTHQLTQEHLVIADQQTAQALAGIMGGASSEISNNTQRVAIESANFLPTTIRLGAQRLAIRTDGSTRHEKNLPVVFPELGMWRALELLQDLAGAQVASQIVDERTTSAEPKPITLEVAYVQRLTGAPIAEKQIVEILSQLGCTVSGAKTLQVVPPTHRSDLTIAEELIEEVARMYGYQAITPAPSVGTLDPQPVEPIWKLAQQLVQKAIEAGAYEVYNYSFCSAAKGDNQSIRLLNPINPDQAVLRQNLRTNLLGVSERNLDRGERDFTLVEYGHVYLPGEEQDHLAIQCVGNGPDVYRRAKGFQTILGCAGELSIDQVGKWYAATLEIDLHGVLIQEKKFIPIPDFPGIELDLSIEFPESPLWSDIESVIRKFGGDLVVMVDVFDMYKNALGIRLLLQSADRTLAMDEAEKIRDTIVQALQKQFNAIHRY